MPASPPSSASYHSCLTAFPGLALVSRFGLVLVLAEPIDLFCQKHMCMLLSAYGYLSLFLQEKCIRVEAVKLIQRNSAMGWPSWQSSLVDSWELGMNDQM